MEATDMGSMIARNMANATAAAAAAATTSAGVAQGGSKRKGPVPQAPRPQASRAELTVFRKHFDLIDEDGSNSLSPGELAKYMSHLGAQSK